MINGQCCLQIPIEHKLYNSLDLTTEAVLKIIYIYIYTYIYAFQHIYTHTHTHTHIHTHSQKEGKCLLLFLLRRYSPLCALASLMISLHRSLSRAFFHHAFTSSVLRSFNTESSHLNPGLPLFLLPSGLEKVTFLQGTLSYILANCPNRKTPTTTPDETFLQDMREPNRPQKQPITSLTPDQPSVSW